MKLIKITDKDGYTGRNHFSQLHWSIGKTNVAFDVAHGPEWAETRLSIPSRWEPPLLGTLKLLTVFETPELASFMRLQYEIAGRDYLAWEVEGEVFQRHGQLRCGSKKLTVIRNIFLPEITTGQRVEIALRLAVEVEPNDLFKSWAMEWINGHNREIAIKQARSYVKAKNEPGKVAVEDAYNKGVTYVTKPVSYARFYGQLCSFVMSAR